jgi:RHS repeat-associated protein
MRAWKNRSLRFGFAARACVALLSVFLIGFAFFQFPANASKKRAASAKAFQPSNLLKIQDFKLKSRADDGEFRLQTVNEGFSAPSLLDYHAATGNLLISSGQPAKLELFSKNRGIEFISNKLFPVANPLSIAAARDKTGRFVPGEVFLGFENGTIFRVSADGARITKIKLPREKSALSGGLIVDKTNVFGGDLIAATGDGKIWRVDESGGRNLFIGLNTEIKGLEIIPNDFKRFGTLAGKLIVGTPEQRGLFAIDENGQMIFFPLDIKPQDIDLIVKNENLFAVATDPGKIFGLDAKNFSDKTGDILITSAESKEFYVLRWDGAGFQISTFKTDEKIAQTTFAPVKIEKDSGGCVASLSAVENVFQWEGEFGSFDVAAPPDCNWTATSGAAWLSVISGQTGTGNGTVRYFVTKNGTNLLRDANITVDGLAHRVRQSKKDGMRCNAGADAGNQNLGAGGGNGIISINGNPDCAWRAESDSPWLTLTGNVFGAGNGTIFFTAATNFTAQVRQARVSFAGGTATVTQAPNLAPTVTAGNDQTITLPNTASLSGSASDDGIGSALTVSWSKISGDESVLFSNANNLTTTAIFSKAGVYILRLTATDGYLTSTDDVQITVNQDPTPLPPDPTTTAPPLDPTIVTNIAKATEFLYTGANPIQTGVNPSDIKAERVGLIRGRVVDKAGQPVSNVKISILDHAEFGQTRSRADGRFDLVVNGGGDLTVKYEKQGFIPAQREEKIDWQVYSRLEDVVLIPFDGNVKFIDLNSSLPIQVAEGSLITDAEGTRRSRLFFKQGTTAVMTLPDNSTQPLTTMNVRSTEFTVGANGPETMPAALPVTSEYTYASEYSVDEAVALNATNVSFSQPVIQYLENFLGFPTGVPVPTGSYNRLSAEWKAETSGKVVKILSITDGIAGLDVTGNGLPATDPEYAALGINIAERQKLAEIYAVNQTLWRVPLNHFTPWDCNYPPANRPPPDVAPPFVERKPKKDCECDKEDKVVQKFQSQSVEETIEIHRTGYQIIYDSSTQGGSLAALIPLVGPTPPPSELEQVAAIVTVAGQTTRSDLMTPSPNLSLNYTWDGNDYAGRRVQGPQTAYVKVVHLYPIGYVLGNEFGQTGNGGGQTFVRTGAGITMRDFEIELGSLDRGRMGLGGWSLNVHHTFDPVTQTLYEGGGRQRQARTVSSVVNTTVGTGESGFGGDGGRAENAKLFEPSDVAFAPDGSYYIADRLNNRVRRVTRDGIISTFAGDGTESCDPALPCGDGGPAVNATLSNPVSVAVAPDGSVFVTDTNRNRIRKIDTGGIITTVAGDGNTCDPTLPCGDGGSAASASLNQPKYIHLAQDGSMFIGDSGSHRVRKIGTNGNITTVAGSGAVNCASDNVPARMACIESPTGVALDANGSLYITGNGLNNARLFRLDADGLVHVLVTGDPCNGALQENSAVGPMPSVCNPRGVNIGPDGNPYFAADNRIFKFDTDGTLKTAFGTLDNNYNGEGQPVTTANFSLPAGATFAPDGNIYVAAANDQRIRKVTPTLPGFTGNDLLIPSEDGTEVFQFNADGRHLRTLNALTGTDKYVFGYSPEGALTSITDGDNNVTTIERDAAGKPTGIRSPYGQLTTLTLDANGYIASITNPAGESNSYTYTSDGLMLTKRDPLNNLNTFTYDAQRRLVSNQNAAGGSHLLSRTGNAQNYTVTYKNPLNRTSTFEVQNLPNGDEAQTDTYADGTVYHTNTAADGSTSEIQADGSTSQTILGPDPRWGMQSPLETNASVLTPGGLNSNATFGRTASLGAPANPLSLITQTDTLNINGQTYKSVFTASNRTFVLTTPENRQATAVIDGQERVTQFQLADLNSGNYTYDTRGRLSVAALGTGAAARTFNFAYNTAGFLSSFTNPLNQTTAFTYDLAGRVTQQTLHDNRAINFGYDANGNLTSVTPPGRPAHIFTYNSLDLISSYVAPNVGGSSTTTYEYNLDRDISRITRPDSLQLNYAYDAGGRLQTLTVPNGSYVFAYQAATGLVSSITAPGGGVVAYQNDGFLPTRETWTGAVAGNVSRTYDANFCVTSESVNDASTVNFTYDNDSLLTGAGSLSLTRNPTNGLLAGTTLGSVTDTYTYNGFAEPTNYNAKFNAATLYDVNVTYDKLGRITQKTETIGGVAVIYDYGYDSTGRLTTVTLNGAPQPLVIYSYDGNDNRASINVGGSVTNGTYDAQDRLTQFGNTTYTYTANGELQSKTNASQTTQYGYDVLGNLRNVTLPDGTQIEYVIDGQDRRIGKKINGTLTQGFLYQDQLEPVAELDGSNNIVSRFVYGTRSNVPDYMIKSGVTYRIITDQAGSVRLVVDAATGNIAQRIDYDEFGVVLNDTNPGFQPFGFAGGLYDTQTGLTRFGARDYDAQTGRWTAKDPILFDGGDSNLYVYCLNDPLNQIDPDGLLPISPSDVPSIPTSPKDLVKDVIKHILRKTIEIQKVVLKKQTCKETKTTTKVKKKTKTRKKTRHEIIAENRDKRVAADRAADPFNKATKFVNGITDTNGAVFRPAQGLEILIRDPGTALQRLGTSLKNL